MVRWGPTEDQTLFLKIIEISGINVDSKAVAAAWPESMEKPTARAISERLVRLRALAKAETNKGPNGNDADVNGDGQQTSTPQKKGNEQLLTPSTNGSNKKSAPRKRKAKAEFDDEAGIETPSKRGKKAKATPVDKGIKPEPTIKDEEKEGGLDVDVEVPASTAFATQFDQEMCNYGLADDDLANTSGVDFDTFNEAEGLA